MRYGELIKNDAIANLPKTKKSYRDLHSGIGVFFRKTGGQKCVDRDETAAWLTAQDADTQAKLGVDWKISFNVKKLYPYATELKIPGIVNTPTDDFGRMDIGSEKPWSPNKAKERLDLSLKKLCKLRPDSEDDQETA